MKFQQRQENLAEKKAKKNIEVNKMKTIHLCAFGLPDDCPNCKKFGECFNSGRWF